MLKRLLLATFLALLINGCSQTRQAALQPTSSHPLEIRSPGWSPSGKYLSVRLLDKTDHSAQLVIFDPTTGKPTFNRQQMHLPCSWSPIGPDKFAYVVPENGDLSLIKGVASKNPALFSACWLVIATPAGKELAKYHLAAEPLSTCWSPDGHKLALHMAQSAKPSLDIFKVADNGSIKLLKSIKLPKDFLEVATAWQPNGKLIAATVVDLKSRSFHLLAIDTVSGAQRVLRQDGQPLPNNSFFDFAWSTDGQQLFFPATGADNQTKVYSLGLEPNATPKLIIDSGLNAQDAAWATDRKQLVLLAGDQQKPHSPYGTNDLVFFDRATGQIKQLTSGGNTFDCALSPDSHTVAAVRGKKDRLTLIDTHQRPRTAPLAHAAGEATIDESKES